MKMLMYTWGHQTPGILQGDIDLFGRSSECRELKIPLFYDINNTQHFKAIHILVQIDGFFPKQTEGSLPSMEHVFQQTTTVRMSLKERTKFYIGSVEKL